MDHEESSGGWDHFGVPLPADPRLHRGVRPLCRPCLPGGGARLDQGCYRVYAPSGFEDLFGFVVCPNTRRRAAPRVRDQGRPLAAAVAPPRGLALARAPVAAVASPRTGCPAGSAAGHCRNIGAPRAGIRGHFRRAVAPRVLGRPPAALGYEPIAESVRRQERRTRLVFARAAAPPPSRSHTRSGPTTLKSCLRATSSASPVS
jgi:hypothetical protein